MKNAVIALLVLLNVALVIYLVRTFTGETSSGPVVTPDETAVANRQAEAEASSDRLKRFQQALAKPAAPQPLPEPRTRTAPARGDRRAAAPAVPVRQDPAPEAGTMQEMMEMLETPEMKQMVRVQQKMALAQTHGTLFDYLQLPLASLQQLQELIVERQMVAMDAGLEALWSGESTGPGLSEQFARIEQATQAVDNQIRALLGEEDYAIFKEYEDTQPERMQVQQFQTVLPSDVMLTPEQEHALIVAMNDVREISSVELAPERMPEDPFSAEGQATVSAYTRLMHEEYLTSAAAILDPVQLEQFSLFLDTQLSMQEMGMRMAESMFGAGLEGAAGSR